MTEIAKRMIVRDLKHNGRAGIVVHNDDGKVTLEDPLGRQWKTASWHCQPYQFPERTDGRPSRLERPELVAEMVVSPTQVQVGDFVCLGGQYRRVNDMRGWEFMGRARVLILDGMGPWRMNHDRAVFRPVAELTRTDN